MCIIVERNYPGLRVRINNCEILVVIYTFFRVLGNENTGSGRVEESPGAHFSLLLVMGRIGNDGPLPYSCFGLLGDYSWGLTD